MEEVFRNIAVVWDYVMRHLLMINMLLAVIIVFFQRKEPKSVWAWLLILYFLPIVGFIFYLIAGTDMYKRKKFRTKEAEDQISEAIREQEHSIRTKELARERPELAGYADLVYYNLESAGAVLTGDNAVDFFTDGNEKFDALIEDMKAAKDFIHMQYYIIKNDVLFERIRAVLEEKAREGVEVRILFDAMGCRGVKHSYWKKLREAGIQTAEFFPASLRRLHLRINYRNHRKIVVIDGKKAYLGGFNIGKEYIGLDPKFGYWRDTHLRIEGTAVLGLELRFIMDWNYTAKENLFREEKYFVLPEKPCGNTIIQIIDSGPDTSLQNIHNNYLRLIAKAEKSIYIQTPYFVPDEAILNALIIAAYSGIDVRVMIPCKPDHPFVYWATYSYIGDLVQAGAKCYTYQNGFLHAKGLIVDEKVLCYGTANMDIRSFQLNFEVNAVIYGQQEAKKMTAVFENDLKYCKQITKDLYNRRSLLIRVKEQFCRLLSPVL
ncbi:MAG: cardiolipin synthase [Lachnospiraceae bacterium]|nr:cardiolipin synthase [Lachnospiraceae bacterium]